MCTVKITQMNQYPDIPRTTNTEENANSQTTRPQNIVRDRSPAERADDVTVLPLGKYPPIKAKGHPIYLHHSIIDRGL